MSDSTAQEPTMEEILASIRRIISEDDAPVATPSAEAAPSPTAPAHQPPPASVLVDDDEDEEDVLELTQPLSRETHGDIDVFEPPKPAPEPVKAAAPPAPPPPAPTSPPAPASPPAMTDDEPLVSGSTEDKAASHFGLLAQSIALPAPGRTLEDLVREMMRPMLKDWLDQHLTGIVEARVQAEVERVSRRRV